MKQHILDRDIGRHGNFAEVCSMKVILENVSSENSQLLKKLAKALGLKFKAVPELADETTYLKSSKTMTKHLDKAIAQEKAGEGQPISLDDVWK